jgi:hypothetical protein
MARITYSALIENISGSIAGTTFQSNKYGFTVKKKPNIVVPRSPTQQRQQKYMSLAVSAWKSLTASQRTDWDTWAATYPQYAHNNPTSVLSGYAVFVKVHILRFMANLSVLPGPTYTSYAEDTLTYSVFRYSYYFSVTLNSTNESENWYINFSLSRPFAPTQAYIGTKIRYIDSYKNLSDDYDISPAYTALYGALPSVGDLVALQTLLFAKDNGQVLAKYTEILEVGTL